jgi:trans-aconitate 2-methyltransferase
MPVSTWSPERYLRYADERSRPFHELLARVRADEPRRLVDLGCGPGGLTAALAERWPSAEVVGVDSSPEMIEAAAAHAGPRVRFELGDIATWRPAEPVDVIVANAALQWVPGHRGLLPGLVDALADGGWLAIQVPGNFDEPSHVLLHSLAADARFAAATRAAQRPSAHNAATYLADLSGLGCTVDAWETTYLHVLEGPDPVFGWISGTGARPILQALPGDLRAEFENEYKAMLRDAYPEHRHGTVLPFRRVFAVARKAV